MPPPHPSPSRHSWVCSDLTATEALAAALAAQLRPGDVVWLHGELGAGKTAFAQGFGAALGIDQPITSPTFNLVHSYPLGHVTLHHADLYRLGTQHELDDLALPELADDRGIVLVEWGDVVEAVFGEHLTVRLDPTDDDDMARLITIHATGPAWAARGDAVRAAVASC